MRRVQSLLKTMLMLIPMTAVPVMALFGIPQFFPVSASPSARPDQSAHLAHTLERRVGQSDALHVRQVSTEPAASMDLFQPYDAAGREHRFKAAGVVANGGSSELERRRLVWTDPLGTRPAAPSPIPHRPVGMDRRSDGGSLTQATTRSRRFNTGAGSPAGFAFTGGAAALPDTTADQTESTSSFELNNETITRSESITRESRPGDVKAISWSEAVERLNQLGIRTYSLTPNPGKAGYRFVCQVTSADDPRISRRFEAESADPLLAVGRVLAQVENWNLHQ